MSDDGAWSRDPDLRALFAAEAAVRLGAMRAGDDVVEHAHALTGAAGVLGLGAVAEAAHALETAARGGADTDALVDALAAAIGDTGVVAAPTVAKPAARTCTVLVVDDAEPVRALLRTVLLTAGHRVVEAAEGGAAMAVLARTPVDVVVTDVHMPGLDGLALLEAVGGAVPVVVLAPEPVAGAAATVSKVRFDPAALLAAVDQAVSRSG